MSEKQVCKAIVMSVISAECFVSEKGMEVELILRENDEKAYAIYPRSESLGDILRVFGVDPKYGCRLGLLQGRTCCATVNDNGNVARLHRHGEENIAWEAV